MKTFSVCLLVFGVLMAPTAQAWEVLPSSCMPMKAMSSAPMACCGAGCDCSIKTDKEDLSFSLPGTVPKLELLSSSAFTETASLAVVSASSRQEKRGDESPPSEDPLYQLYSDYRL